MVEVVGADSWVLFDEVVVVAAVLLFNPTEENAAVTAFTVFFAIRTMNAEQRIAALEKEKDRFATLCHVSNKASNAGHQSGFVNVVRLDVDSFFA